MQLEMMSNRSGVVKGVISTSKPVEVYDIDEKLIREFGSVKEMEKKSQKYLGVFVTYTKITLYCKTGKLYEGKYYFKMKESFLF